MWCLLCSEPFVGMGSGVSRMCLLAHRLMCVCACVLSHFSRVWLLDYSPPGSSVHGIHQARILVWATMPSSRGSSRPGDRTHVYCGSCTAGGFFTAEPPGKPCVYVHEFYYRQKLHRSLLLYLSSVQLLSCVQLFATPWTAAHQASWSISNSRSSLKLMSIESVMPSNHLILCCSLLLLPSIFPSIRVFSNESVLRIRWPKYWSFSFSISPSNENSGLISFRMDWLDLLAVQGTLKSLLQHHSSKASILWCSAFFIVQLTHPYMTTGKTISLTRQTFDGKVMSLLFNMLLYLLVAINPHLRDPLLVYSAPRLSVKQ